jgi:hypothetical protein
LRAGEALRLRAGEAPLLRAGEALALLDGLRFLLRLPPLSEPALLPELERRPILKEFGALAG